MRDADDLQVLGFADSGGITPAMACGVSFVACPSHLVLVSA